MGGHLRGALQGEEVVLLGRTKPVLLDNERWVFADLSDPVAPEALAGEKVLVHLAYSIPEGCKNVAHNKHLLDAVNACPDIEQVVFLSSSSVYGRSALPVVDEGSPCDAVGEYASTKLACEMLWRKRLREDCNLVVLRPTEVIGPGGKGLVLLIRDAIHRPVVAAIKRSVLYHRSLHYVAVTNVVSAVLYCLRGLQPSTREIYLVSGDHYPENRSYACMQDTVRRIVGKHPLIGPVTPRWALDILGTMIGRPLALRQVFSSKKLQDAGFVDAISVGDEIRNVVRKTS